MRSSGPIAIWIWVSVAYDTTIPKLSGGHSLAMESASNALLIGAWSAVAQVLSPWITNASAIESVVCA